MRGSLIHITWNFGPRTDDVIQVEEVSVGKHIALIIGIIAEYKIEPRKDKAKARSILA